MNRLEVLKKELNYAIEYGASQEEINKILKSIEKSKKGRTSKRKGASFERTVIKVLNKYLPDLTFARTPMSGGFHKTATKESLRGDISCLDEGVDFLLHLEAKNQKTLHIKEWWKQATGDCPEGKIPTLVIHLNQEKCNNKITQKPEDFIFLRLNDFLSIVDKDKIVKKILDKN